MSGVHEIEADDDINETMSRIASSSQRSVMPCTEPPADLTGYDGYEADDPAEELFEPA